jgi:hypothetical protein
MLLCIRIAKVGTKGSYFTAILHDMTSILSMEEKKRTNMINIDDSMNSSTICEDFYMRYDEIESREPGSRCTMKTKGFHVHGNQGFPLQPRGNPRGLCGK